MKEPIESVDREVFVKRIRAGPWPKKKGSPDPYIQAIRDPPTKEVLLIKYTI